MDFFFSLFMSGLTKGSIYALIALGYTMVYGIIALINFAHGEIYMIGAFIALIFTMHLSAPPVSMTGWTLLLTVAAIAAIYSGMYGWTVEKIAYQPLRGASRLAPLISAIGMSIFLQNYVQLVQTSNFLVFPDLIPQIELPLSWAKTLNRTNFIILIFTALSMATLTFFIKFTRMGMAMRAVAQDPTMAQLSGINLDRVISVTFIIGSVLAALGGLLIGCSIRQIDFYIGFLAGMKAFTAAVLGGIGSIPGAVIGALILGFAESFAAGYISSSYKDMVAFIILIIILTFRPGGIMGTTQTQKV
ncbi:MAG: branched-chain amino acid ABC transporter permease LivH [Deltaproteobacteria bacterium]|jgi:branched-chain amino acid transport system permease protein|nr:branched-chain amino acid ABC transporter permease LivH [Deltaproteobacteria bacterium]